MKKKRTFFKHKAISKKWNIFKQKNSIFALNS